MKTTANQGGVTGKGFMPGKSGNPGGRPHSLKNAVVKVCGADGDKLVKMWALIAWGTDKAFWDAYGRQTKRTLKDRMDAARELADRGYGRPVQAVEMTGADGNPLEIKEIRESIASKLSGLAARLGASGVVSEPY